MWFGNFANGRFILLLLLFSWLLSIGGQHTEKYFFEFILIHFFILFLSYYFSFLFLPFSAFPFIQFDICFFFSFPLHPSFPFLVLSASFFFLFFLHFSRHIIRFRPFPPSLFLNVYTKSSSSWCTPAGWLRLWFGHVVSFDTSRSRLCQHDTGRRPLSQSGVQKQAFNWFDIANDTWHAATNELRLPTRTPWWNFSWPFRSFTRIIHLVYFISSFAFWMWFFFNFYFCRFFKFFSWSVILCNFRLIFFLFCY